MALSAAVALAALAAAAWRMTAARGDEPSRAAPGAGRTGSTSVGSPDSGSGPIQGARFVGRQACVECHAAEAAAWAGSDHDRAMEAATDSTVLGRFDGDTLVAHGQVSRFFKRDGRFWVRTGGPDGKPGEFPVKYTFGVRPLQQYLVEFPGGRLQALSLAWDTRKQAWFDLHPERRIPPDDWLHWTRDGQNWNGMCADCHSTGLRRGHDAEKNAFRTSWREMDVSCEACHGPGSEHARLAGSNRVLQYLSGYGPRNRYGLPANHHNADSRGEVMACARCHARRMLLKPDFTHAREFLDEYDVELLRENVYHADGQVLDENYEYGSFLQSRMYHEGVRCSDCHDPHALKTRAPGNALCTRCHETARFDAPAHHGHAAGSSGSLCVECHMPAKHYMQVDLRRDHSLRIPRPDLTERFGTPNACNGCHADRSPAWAAEWVVKWHGPARKPHFSELLAKGRSGGPGADTALDRLAGDTAFPGIARASALALAAYMGRLAEAALVRGARDRDPLVRRAAAAGLEDFPGDVRIPALAPLLADSLRAVRVAAAQALVTASPLLPDSARAAYGRALGEYREALDANAYFPGGRFNRGQFHEKQGRADSAAREYAAALALDNRFIPARINLAQLLDRLGRPDESERHFREALRLNPEFAETPYMLGLLLASRGRLDSAAASLEAAAKAMPGNARVFYNLGLLRQKLGQAKPAESALLEAARLAPGDPDYANALRWFYTTPEGSGISRSARP